MIRAPACLAALACAVALAACGQKGPLKHPEALPTKPAPTSPAPANE
jgi:predicted small lipoprotein YifL